MKRIFDPLHHFIEIDEFEAALLDVPAMQRLRRLRQLGLAYLAYPSAEHSRFSHALGALAVGSRVFDALRRHSPHYFQGEADFAEQRRLLRASLLLHDVGHGPFSHACEAVLGVAHEARTAQILRDAQIAAILAGAGIDPRDVLQLVTGDPQTRFPVLRELVSGPNLDADRMDYLLRDAYFTGVVNGRYDIDQLVESLRVFDETGIELGVDGRGVVALESFVLARYMMFATVYFHHTTRMFERALQDALREIWPDPRALDATHEYLAWDDFRVLDELRRAHGEAAFAVRNRETIYGVAAEFNGERDLGAYQACLVALRERYGEDAVWGDAQEQLLHRLPLGVDEAAPTVHVQKLGRIVDAREASDLIGRLAEKAYWRKIFVRKRDVPLEDARRVALAITGSSM